MASLKQSGDLRFCLDSKDLNVVIIRPYRKTTTLEELTYHLQGSQIFSKLDVKDGYWTIRLDKESSMLTTFNIPLGRYRFLKLLFGHKMSKEGF